MSYTSLPELQEIHSKSHASFSSKVFLGLFFQRQGEQSNLGRRPHYKKVLPSIPWDEVDILSQTCAYGKGEEGKETEEDELAKNWHNGRGLSLPPKPLKAFSFLNGQMPMMNDSHKAQKPRALQHPKGKYLNPPSIRFGRGYGCSSSDTLFLSGSEPHSRR